MSDENASSHAVETAGSPEVFDVSQIDKGDVSRTTQWTATSPPSAAPSNLIADFGNEQLKVS